MWILWAFYKKTKQHTETVIRSKDWWGKRKGKTKNNDDDTKFLTVTWTEKLMSESLIKCRKLTFAEFRLPKRILSDAGTIFNSEKFKDFCEKLNTEQAVSSYNHHQTNGQVEAYIKFVKWTMKKCFDTSTDVNLAPLQTRSMLVDQDFQVQPLCNSTGQLEA